MHLYPSFRGEGCPVAMVTRWLIGRTTDAGRRWFAGGLGGKSFEGFLAAWSIIPRDGRGRLWSVQWPWQCPITSRKLHHSPRGEPALSLPSFFFSSTLTFITGHMKICLPSARRYVTLFIFFHVLIRLLTFCKIMVGIYSSLTHFYVIIKSVGMSFRGTAENSEFYFKSGKYVLNMWCEFVLNH